MNKRRILHVKLFLKKILNLGIFRRKQFAWEEK